MQDLSSPLTFVVKYVLLTAWIVGGGAIVVAAFLRPERFLISGGESLPAWVAWFVLFMVVVGVVAGWQFVRPLVRVALGPDHIEVRTLRSRRVVPIGEIRGVRCRPGTRGMVVDVEFCEQPAFGNRVTFLAVTRDSGERLQARVRASH